MIFEMGESCFANTPKTFELLQLANFVLQGRHRLYVKDVVQADYLSWLGRLPSELLDVWNLSLDLSMEQEALEPARITITVCEFEASNPVLPSPILSVVQASRLAAEPYRIFVENDDADRDFLITYADDNQRRKIKELESSNLIRFEHCGGIGKLKKKVAKFAEKAALYPAICTAVFDSDAPQPDESSKEALAVSEACESRGVVPFMLKRRAIENYLLRSWLKTWINKSRERREKYLTSYNCFCELSPAQRSHFHMKKGLSSDMKRISDGTIALFNSVNDEGRRTLMTGFGSDVGSDLYSSDWVQDSHPIEDPDAWNEVNGIVKEFLVLSR